MSATFEECEKNLNTLIEWYNNTGDKTRNEATTRLHLIDRILFECLDWEKANCISEENIQYQKIDYSLSCPECHLIVEAKKEGTYFEVPIGTKSLKYNIHYFSKHAPDVFQAIEQAIEYCHKKALILVLSQTDIN